MTSKLTIAEQEDWMTRKKRIREKITALANVTYKTVKEMIPDIKAIKEKELWRHGGYKSFRDFCEKCVGVSRQHVYKLLSEDALIASTLREGSVNYLTEFSGPIPEVLTAQPPPPAAPPEDDDEPPLHDAMPDPAPKEKPAKAKVVGTHQALPMSIPPPSNEEPKADTAPVIGIPISEPAAPIESATRSFHALYTELVQAVETAFPGETRHQTALRYIREAESASADAEYNSRRA